MTVVLSRAILTISIDVELDVERRGLDQQRSLETVTAELAERLARYNLPASWAVADPAVSAATERLLHAGAAHEIAILGDRSWVGREAGRARFARELARRVTRARAAGIEISTLLLRDAELDDHLDLVIKQGLTTIASNTAVGGRSWFGSRQIAGPLPLRFGLWSLPTHAELPGQRGFALWSGSAKRGLRSIDAAIAERGVCHLTINGLALAAQGASAWRAVERVLRHADKRAAAGGLDVKTLAGTSATLAGGRQAAPARSILRPAA